jgi:hypothetical protein
MITINLVCLEDCAEVQVGIDHNEDIYFEKEHAVMRLNREELLWAIEVLRIYAKSKPPSAAPKDSPVFSGIPKIVDEFSSFSRDTVSAAMGDARKPKSIRTADENSLAMIAAYGEARGHVIDFSPINDPDVACSCGWSIPTLCPPSRRHNGKTTEQEYMAFYNHVKASVPSTFPLHIDQDGEAHY